MQYRLFYWEYVVFGIIDIGTYIIGTILIVILPGPNSLYVMSIASRFGPKIGYWGALGVFTGDLILILCTVLGAASLLHTFPWLFILLKIVGALYLSYLGGKLLFAGVKTWHSSPQHLEASANQNTLQTLHPFRSCRSLAWLILAFWFSQGLNWPVTLTVSLKLPLSQWQLLVYCFVVLV